MQLRNRFKTYILISIGAHVLLFASLYLTAQLQKAETASQPIEISFLDPNTEVQPDTKKIPDPKLIVESDSKMANNQVDENAKYLSEKSNTVQQQTRAKMGMKFLNTQQTRNTQAAQPVQPPKPEAQAKPQRQAHSKQDMKLFDSGGFDAYAAMNKKEQARQALPAPQQKNDRNLAAQNQEASSTNDHLENMKDDLMTRLNTREYKYYGYYNRIKTQLNQWWVPQVQQKFTKMMKQGRTIASEENKVTKLIIILNSVGNLVRVQVLSESGVRDLDDAAVEAFRQAAPFPNPPKGMVESDGTVKIRWDCVVES